ncbi:hypothetical protein OH799_17375 [Nocardia sp. NBC_00881]|uniref:hypothetical protein n=1 Tax=Nocardia sp. NBC_00881 TaxID=2975995 RepID=UPI00386A379A|nr:hypothetical protein OH799_17375 [Nocardia sp. NBC_00881]
MGNPFSNPAVEDLSLTVLRNVTDWIFHVQPDADPYAVQDTYNRQRDDVRSRAAGLGFQGEFRPREVLDADEFERHDVRTLRSKVDQIDLQAVSDLVSAWNTIADRHQTSLDTFTTAMARATDESVWRGEARDAAASGVRDYADQGAQVTNAARLTSSKLAELQTGLEPTKQLVPHAPEHRSGVDNAIGLLAGRSWRNDDVAEHNSKTEALRVLRTVYAPVVMESDTNVPVIPRPAPATNPGGNPAGADNGSNTGDTNTGSGNPSGTPSPGSNPLGTDSSDDSTTPSSTQPTDVGTPQSTSSDPASTTPASTTPASTTTSSTAGNPHLGTPGSPGSPTGPGAPVPSPGRSIPGTPNNSSATAAAARSGTAPGRPGMGGMPGGTGPGARGGKSDDESSKGIPDYLVTQEHGDELTGLDNMPKAVPPVIGE